MASDKAFTRRRYSEMEKAQVLAECAQPGASVAKVALAHGVNANVVHRWRQLAREGTPSATVQRSEFIALPLPALTAPCTSAAPAPSADIRIELQRGPLALRITWPTSAAQELAAWTRELLR
ncbi:MAG: transposase [Burkholderiales bacterium]|nr:transposase [Burkholderiales bacterium]